MDRHGGDGSDGTNDTSLAIPNLTAKAWTTRPRIAEALVDEAALHNRLEVRGAEVPMWEVIVCPLPVAGTLASHLGRLYPPISKFEAHSRTSTTDNSST